MYVWAHTPLNWYGPKELDKDCHGRCLPKHVIMSTSLSTTQKSGILCQCLSVLTTLPLVRWTSLFLNYIGYTFTIFILFFHSTNVPKTENIVFFFQISSLCVFYFILFFNFVDLDPLHTPFTYIRFSKDPATYLYLNLLFEPLRLILWVGYGWDYVRIMLG